MGSRHSRAGLSRHSRGSLLSFPRVSPVIPAGLPRHSRAGGNPYRCPGYETTCSLHHGQQPEKPEVGTSDLAIW